jgi:hypothetical protein
MHGLLEVLWTCTMKLSEGFTAPFHPASRSVKAPAQAACCAAALLIVSGLVLMKASTP